MKILQLIQKPQPRGAETFAVQLSKNLLHSGHLSEIITLFDSTDRDKFNHPYELLGADLNKRFWDRKGWKNLAKIIQEKKPDIVQANAGDTLKYAALSKMFHNWEQPIIFRNASTLSLYINNPVQKIYNRFLYKQIKAIASVCEHSKNDLLHLYPYLKDITTTIPIGLEEKKSVISPYPSEFDDKIRLVHVGGFSFEKNHEGLLRIFKSFAVTNNKAHLWLVGDGPLRKSIEAKVDEMGLGQKVHFTGFVNNSLDYVAYAHVLLLPSKIEGLPGVILEAMLYETPVIANNVGGIGEIVKSNETGWLIDPEDGDAFSNAIDKVINLDESVKNKILYRAQQLVKESYMNSNITTQFMNLYAKLLIRN
jgi:L-malate glycosyltransferase